jgi:hypothetical protein
MNSVSRVVLVYSDDKILQFDSIPQIVAFYELSKYYEQDVAFEKSKEVVAVWANTPNTPNIERVAYLVWEFETCSNKDFDKVAKYVAKKY